MNKISAFSLIELSIVLIIIGLLIAGVTSGRSLIDSARVKSMINEMRDYERAVFTFQAVKGRYPGDVKNYGAFGWNSNYDSVTCGTSDDNRINCAKPYYKYLESDFPSSALIEFRKTAGDGAMPNSRVAPFFELYNEGIIDFKPLGNTYNTANKNSSTKGTPNSKSINSNNTFLYFIYTGTYPYYQGIPESNSMYYKGLSKFGSMAEILSYVFQDATYKKGMDPKILRQVDTKLDDGEYWNGRIRSACYGKDSAGSASDTADGYTDYKYAVDNGKKCSRLSYAL